MIDSPLYGKLTTDLKRLKNLTYSENSTYDKLVAHLQRELKLSGLEKDGELTISTMATTTTTVNKQN